MLYVFLEVKFAYFFVNSEKKFTRFHFDGDYAIMRVITGQLSSFFSLFLNFFSEKLSCFVFYCSTKIFAKIVNVFFSLKF